MARHIPLHRQLPDILPMQRPPSGNMPNPKKRLRTRSAPKRLTQQVQLALHSNTLRTREALALDMEAMHTVEILRDRRNRKLLLWNRLLGTDAMPHHPLDWPRE